MRAQAGNAARRGLDRAIDVGRARLGDLGDQLNCRAG